MSQISSHAQTTEISNALAWVSLLILFICSSVIVVYLVQFRNIALSCVSISGIRPNFFMQTTGALECDKSMDRKPLLVQGRSFTHGIGTHSFSSIRFPLAENIQTFHSYVGLPDYLNGTTASVEFEVYGNSQLLWRSGVLHAGELKEISLSIQGLSSLELKVNDGGDGNNWDHACWLDPEFR